MKPGTIGSNPAFTFGLPVAAIMAIDRPWKLRCSETIFHFARARPRSLASLTAASFASSPLWQKNARPGNAVRSSRSAKSICGVV